MRRERAYLILRDQSMGEVHSFGMLGLLAATPALPLDEAGKYVAGAYIVFLALIVIYVAIMATKLQRIEKDLRDVARFAEQGSPGTPGREAEDNSDQAAPGRGSEGPSISDSLAPHGSRGGGA
jgi:hypothetical protein